MVAETKKIIDPSIKVTATCVRVPVFVGHSEAINIEFEDFLDEEEAREILREAPGVLVVDKREPAATSPRSSASASTRPTSAASARTRRSTTACHLGGLRQPAQGRRAQRRADRRAARPAGAEEGLRPVRHVRNGSLRTRNSGQVSRFHRDSSRLIQP